jgi:hypothetical protein
VFPFWNPYSEAGRLFIGEPTTGAFYPFNWLLAVLPLRQGMAPAWGLEYLVVIHFFLASLFTYLLARHWGLSKFSSVVAGITFAYSGSLALRYFAQITVFTASIWIPAVFLCYSNALRSKPLTKRLAWSNAGGLSLALGLLAGHHQPVLYCGMAVAISALLLAVSPHVAFGDNLDTPVSRSHLLLSLLLLCAFAAMYSSLQLFPSLQYAHYAYRWVGLPGPVSGMNEPPYSVAGTMYGLTPSGLLLLIVPFTGGAETNPYFGILPLFLVLLSLTRIKSSRTCRLLWFIAVLFFLIALGAYTPVHGLLYFLVPGFAKAREAARALVMTHFSCALLAAMGCDALLASYQAGVAGFARRIIHGFSIAALITFVVVTVMYLHASVAGQAVSAYEWLFVSSLLMLMTAAVGLSRVHGLLQRESLQVLMLIILLFDVHGILATTLKPKSDFNADGNYEPTRWYKPDSVVGFLKAQPGPFRINVDKPYPRSLGEVLQLETVNGYGATEHRSFADLMALRGPAYALLNVKYTVTRNSLPYPKVYQDGPIKVYQSPDCLPRVWLAEQIVTERTQTELLSHLKDPLLDLRHVALLLADSPRSIPDLPVTSRATAPAADPGFVRKSSNQFLIEADVRRAAMLVVSETWYPGWHVRLNGEDRHLWQVDGSLMGVYVQPGDNHLQFSFRPDYLYLEVGATILAFLILLACLILNRREATP